METVVLDYLKEPPSAATLLELIGKLDEDSPQDLVREGKPLRDLGIERGNLTAEGVAQLLAKHPQLLQRPVAVCGEKAIIARPPERLLRIL